MSCQRSLFEVCRDSLILLVTLVLSTVCIAETYEFRAAYYVGPGIEEAKAGNLDAAIEILESREKMADNHFYVADELATLCGFYIVNGNLDAARETCSAAVEIGQSDFAYNNRGVLRMKLGDIVGALEDFDRVRVLPDDQPRFIEQLKERNTRLIASRNFAQASEMAAKRRINKPTMAGAVKGANIEDINQ